MLQKLLFQILLGIDGRGIFRLQSNIENGAFFAKILRVVNLDV